MKEFVGMRPGQITRQCYPSHADECLEFTIQYVQGDYSRREIQLKINDRPVRVRYDEYYLLGTHKPSNSRVFFKATDRLNKDRLSNIIWLEFHKPYELKDIEPAK